MKRNIHEILRVDKEINVLNTQVKSSDTLVLILKLTEKGKFLDLSNETMSLDVKKMWKKTFSQSSNIIFSKNQVVIEVDSNCIDTVGKTEFTLNLLTSNKVCKFCLFVCKEN